MYYFLIGARNVEQQYCLSLEFKGLLKPVTRGGLCGADPPHPNRVKPS